MNAKKVNWMYVVSFAVYLIVNFAILWYAMHIGLHSVYPLYLINELIYLVPAFLFVICSGTHLGELLEFPKIKVSTALMTVLFAFLCMPLASVCNLFSMFFVDNTVAANSETIMRMPFAAAFFLIAVYAPVCEEIIFRGITFGSLKKGMNTFQAVLISALFFALAHMNFNQAAYAIVLGVILVLLKEATGSLRATILFHVVFNGYSVVLLYAQKYAQTFSGPETAADLVQTMTKTQYRDYMLGGISVYMVIAAVTTALAACVLFWIAGNEGRRDRLTGIWKNRKSARGRVVCIPFLLVLVLYIGMMIYDVIAG